MIRALLAEPFDLKRGRVASGCSVGVAFLEAGDASMAEFLKRADVALYAAKGAPDEGFRFFDAVLAAESAAQASLARDLARALDAGEFFLEYQSIASVESRTIRAFEALLRWRHPERGVLLPQAFLPVAEKAGLVRPLGNWMLLEACRVAAGWPAPTGIAVDVAGDQMRERAFVDHVAACIRETGLAPGRLTLEVREAALRGEPAVRETLAALRALGVRVALEGFGAGPSAIESLRAVAFDQLKTDRALVRTMEENGRDADLMDILLRLGRAFQVAVTVEGVETEKQFDLIRRQGACEMQGDLICPPVSAAAAAALLARPESRLSA
jgi:predicted signal transduction protein with EAL and GGDEF domain